MKLINLLIFSMVLVGLIGGLAGGILYYTSANEIIEDEASDNLLAISQSKAEHVETFLTDLKIFVEVAATHSELSEEELKKLINITPNIRSLYVINSEGKTIKSSEGTSCEIDFSKNKIFIEGMKETILANNYFCKTINQNIMVIATPHARGILLAKINSGELEKIVKDRTGLGETGEVLIAIKDGDELQFNFKRLFEEDALDNEVESALPMKQALFGNELLFNNTLDYRGKAVMAASQYIAVADIGLVTKVDREEVIGVYENLLILNSLVIGVIILFISAIVGFFISNSILKSIKNLTQNVDLITKGKLDVQLEKSNIEEIQNLTESLNRILASLKLAILRSGAKKEDFALGEAVKLKDEFEDKYKRLFETSNDAIMVLDNGKFVDCNPATLKIFNIKSIEEFTKLTPADLSPKKQPDGNDSAKQAQKMIGLALKKGTNKFNWVHKRTTGENFNAEVLLTKFETNGKTFVQASVRELPKLIPKK